MKKIALILFLFLIGSSPAFADHASSLDEDTCWDGKTPYGDACMQVHDTGWSKYTDGKFIVKYKNQCQHRIYAKFCNEKKNGNWSCGASGISPGRTKGWSTYDATGRYQYTSIGVDRASKDWVCAHKVRGWSDVGK